METDLKTFSEENFHLETRVSTVYTKARMCTSLIFVTSESEGNVDQRLYAKIPDNKLQLTDKGIRQAKASVLAQYNKHRLLKSTMIIIERMLVFESKALLGMRALPVTCHLSHAQNKHLKQ